MDEDAAWVMLFLLVLGLLWFATKGPSFGAGGGPSLEPRFAGEEISRDSENQGSELSSSGTEGEREVSAPIGEQEISRQKEQKLVLNLSAAGAREENPRKEYLELRISSDSEKDNISITGWTLKNSRNEKVKIGQGAYLVYSGQVNQENDIALKKDERAYIITGRSPAGASFRNNVCTGYFEQFQDFEPSLRKDCPYPRDDEKIKNSGLKDGCLDYIDDLSQCFMPVKDIPLNLDDSCRNYISENINYNGCVNNHRTDENFYGKTWMIYLSRDQEFWKEKRETISLYDQNNKLIAETKY